jgi:hypothetical protein
MLLLLLNQSQTVPVAAVVYYQQMIGSGNA